MTTAHIVEHIKRIEAWLTGKSRPIRISDKSLMEKQEIISRTAGALRSTIGADLLAWQRHIRSEWNRRI